MLFPRLDFKPEENPILFVILLWLTYSAGIYVIGWLSLRLGWRTPEKQYGWRLLTTLLGTFIPLLGAFLLYPRLEPGNPLFFICIITGIIGFLLPEWLKK
jgi:hypothetical protein